MRITQDPAYRSLIWILVIGAAVVQTAGSLGLLVETVGPRIASYIMGATLWLVILALALLATERLGRLTDRLRQHQTAHSATLDQIEQLHVQNALLHTLSRSADVGLALQELARRISRSIPCDRVGVALIKENGQEFQTYTARVDEEERRNRPRPEIEFGVERTIIGNVVRAMEPVVVIDTAEQASDFLDLNVLNNAGLKSALVLPLISKGRAVGTLNIVARRPGIFTSEHIQALKPIAEVFAMAHVSQQLQTAVGRLRLMEAMAEMTLSVGTEINSALQTIIGHCDLLERGYPDPALQRDLATVVRQAQRISAMLEKMRASASERLKDLAVAIEGSGVPSSPEAFSDDETVVESNHQM